MKIDHHITFSGPAFVATSTDETSARETTTATTADVGIDPYDRSVTDTLASLDPSQVQDWRDGVKRG